MSEKNISDFKYDKNINNYSTDFITKYLIIFSKQIKKYLEYYYNKLYKDKINFEKEENKSKEILLKYFDDKKYYKTDIKNFDDFKLYINSLVILFTEFTKNLSNKYIINYKYLHILKNEILLLRNEFAHRNNATIELVLRFFENLYFFNKYINIIEIEKDLLEEWTKKELQFIIHSYLDINLQIDSFKIENENILTSYKKHFNNNEIKFNCKNWNEKGMEKIMKEINTDKIKIKLDYNNSDNEEDNKISYENSEDNNDILEGKKISEDDNEENEEEEEKKNENKNIEDNKINSNNNIKSLNIE